MRRVAKKSRSGHAEAIGRASDLAFTSTPYRIMDSARLSIAKKISRYRASRKPTTKATSPAETPPISINSKASVTPVVRPMSATA